MTMRQFSDHVLAVGKGNRLSVTNLQLQKVMYFAIQDYLRRTSDTNDQLINQIYDTPFQSWQYGPVEPEIYYQYSHFGSMPIDAPGQYDTDYQAFDNSIVTYLREDVFDLVERSHEESFWMENFEEQRQRRNYTLSDILNG